MIEAILGAGAAALIVIGAFTAGRGIQGDRFIEERWGDANPAVVTIARPIRLFVDNYLPTVAETVRKLLEEAGRPYGRQGGTEYLAIAILYALIAGGMLLIFSFLRLQIGPLYALVFACAFVVGVTSIQINLLRSQVNERLRNISRSFPYFLDTMVLSLNAGAHTPEAMDLFIENNPSDPLADEIRTMRDETRAGLRFEAALPGLADRLGNKDLRTVILNIRHGMEMGSSLEEVLRRQSADIRFFRGQYAERAIEKMKVSTKLPLVLMLISALLIMIGPAAIGVANSGLL